MAYADEQLGYWNFVYQAGGYILNEDKTRAGFLAFRHKEGHGILYRPSEGAVVP